jgi:uncharacterized protein (DUF362 family)
MSLVSLVKINENISLKDAIEQSLSLINFRFDSKIKKIAIKPNMCYYWDYSTGETTDPKFVSALIDLIRAQVSKDVDIAIVESDASAMKCSYAFKMLGYEKMASAQNVRLVNLSEDENKEVETQVNGKTYKFLLPKTISDADMFINVPKIKYMRFVGISSSLKNIYGCNPYPQKYKYHKNVDEVIVGLNKIMKPDLCILDGIVVRGIKTSKMDMILASADPVAVDAVSSTIAGVKPNSIAHLKLAQKEQIGNMAFVQKGQQLDCFRKTFPKKTPKYKLRKIVSSAYNRLVALH